MKKILVLLVGLILLTGCSEKKEEKKSATNKNMSSQKATPETNKEEKYYSYLDEVDVSKVDRVTKHSYLSYDISDPESLKEKSDFIFIGRVKSIDGAKSLSEETTSAVTFGKIDVIENLFGDLPKEIPFARYGGYIKIKEYYKNAYPEMIEKINQTLVEKGEKKVSENEEYIEVIETENGEDIHLKAGGVYLFHATIDDRPKYNEYYILQGYQYGALSLQENNEKISTVLTPSVRRSSTSGAVVGKSWTVKNESDGKTEDLGEYLKNIGVEVVEK